MKGDKKIKFDTVISFPCVAIYACHLDGGHEIGAIKTERKIEKSIKHLHEFLRHCDKETTIKIVKHLVWSIECGLMGSSECCVNAKAKK